MVIKVSKADQFQMLRTNDELLEYIPDTSIYNRETLEKFLSSYQQVYVKHNTAGQGRGVFKVWRTEDGGIKFSGFTLHGVEKSGAVRNAGQFDLFLNPLQGKGRVNNYVVQEAVNSTNHEGSPISFRVHVQNMKSGWVVGGMKGATGSGVIIDNGVLNRNRGSITLPTMEVLENVMGMSKQESEKTAERLQTVAIKAAETLAVKYECREYGIDFGVENGIPKIFEMNTAPSIVAFSLLEDKSIWKQIVANRLAQRRGQ